MGTLHADPGPRGKIHGIFRSQFNNLSWGVPLLVPCRLLVVSGSQDFGGHNCGFSSQSSQRIGPHCFHTLPHVHMIATHYCHTQPVCIQHCHHRHHTHRHSQHHTHCHRRQHHQCPTHTATANHTHCHHQPHTLPPPTLPMPHHLLPLPWMLASYTS